MCQEAVKVSVIMPTYRQSALMQKAVRSVLSQTYENIELILVDDNPDAAFRADNAAFVATVADPRLIYTVNEHNLGSAASRNRGIFMAGGEYITFLDDDDYYDPRKIEVQLSEMRAADADVSVCNLTLIDGDGRVVDRRRRKYLRRGEPLLIAHLKYHITATDTMMFRADFLRSIGGFGAQDLGDEFFLMASALEREPKFYHADFDGVFATVHATTGLSSGDNKIRTEEIVYDFVSGYFDRMRPSDVRYIKMRNRSVLATAHRKNRAYLKCLGALLRAFFYHPVGMIRLLVGIDR